MGANSLIISAFRSPGREDVESAVRSCDVPNATYLSIEGHLPRKNYMMGFSDPDREARVDFRKPMIQALNFDILLGKFLKESRHETDQDFSAVDRIVIVAELEALQPLLQWLDLASRTGKVNPEAKLSFRLLQRPEDNARLGVNANNFEREPSEDRNLTVSQVLEMVKENSQSAAQIIGSISSGWENLASLIGIQAEKLASYLSNNRLSNGTFTIPLRFADQAGVRLGEAEASQADFRREVSRSIAASF